MFLKQLREIVFKSLVDNLGVAPALLSRVQGNDPIVIELEGGDNIYVYFQDKTLQTYIEMPLKDRRVLPMKASKFIEVLTNDAQLFMNVQQDKVVLFAELGEDMMHFERNLSEKLNTFNNLANQLKM
ncbi:MULTISPECIES: hypothetical protein [Vibrio harveyi group]|uniref:hypothetical protein n=1 Tax=Vibrio harveyi group TaxID=717610 RepID=UPI001D04C8FA|nr:MULTISPECIES: hypothetical protein [Vibrio harveyi group]MDF5599676.1 hypothetical protein [Vibrio parahaemolyticus]MEA5385445.1 hypothetical protein [Vibrio parahaemolyticus]